ncbi:hypothetical protein Tco_0894787 [Tanacetum coccineum]|uniref:Uncharacterized protein n=1 Tax=Tanacetum coccineum TaxID=301880 RepID=A0ABQ5CCP0_9ASTR
MRISSISIGSSNVQPSEFPYLPVLCIGMSQSRQHDKSESNAPSLLSILSQSLSIVFSHVTTKSLVWIVALEGFPSSLRLLSYHSDVLAIPRG